MNIITDYVLAEVATIGRLYQFSNEDAQDKLAKVELLVATSFFVTDSEKEKILSILAQYVEPYIKPFLIKAREVLLVNQIELKS